MNRQKANRKILNFISTMVEQHPDEESEETFNRIDAMIKKN